MLQECEQVSMLAIHRRSKHRAAGGIGWRVVVNEQGVLLCNEHAPDMRRRMAMDPSAVIHLLSRAYTKRGKGCNAGAAQKPTSTCVIL